jgi:integrase
MHVLSFPPQRSIRRRGPSLSRRIGQRGNVFQKTKPWSSTAQTYGRYWLDTPLGRKRQTVTLGQCANRSAARRKLLAHIEAHGININSAAVFGERTGTVTFGEQAEKWIASLPSRRRRPLKPATIFNWRHALDKWVLPTIGDRLLADVGNGALKQLVETMAAAGLSAKSIVSHSQVVKSVVASAVTSDGEPIYPRKWNHDFIGLPIIDPTKQHRQTITKPDLEDLLANACSDRWRMLFALLAATGLRIGEALGLKTEDFSADCRMVSIRRSLWRGKEQDPKTSNAVRTVDIPEPLAAMLRQFTANRSGYVFCAVNGRPLDQRDALRALHGAGSKVGFHALRRFRTETLRRARVPEDLIRIWLGHSCKSVTDLYAGGLEHDEEWRREWCDTVGMGFGLRGLQNASESTEVKAA